MRNFFKVYILIPNLLFIIFCFSFGISYQGAAQAASGTKEEVKKIRDKSRSLFRNIELFGKKNK